MEPFIIKEDSTERRLRLRQGYTAIYSIDAVKFKERYERDHKGPLAWNKQRAERLLDASVIDSYPKVGYSTETGRIGVLDGRHRIAEAARRGQRIDVAIDPGYPLPKDVDPRPSKQNPERFEDEFEESLSCRILSLTKELSS